MTKIQKTKNPSKDDNPTDKPVSFTKLLLLIPAKFPKIVKEISKFFKKSTKPTENKDSSKSYAQASVPTTSEILKIKEIFPNYRQAKLTIFTRLSMVLGNQSPK